MLLLLQLVVGRKMAAKVVQGIKEVEARGATEVELGVVDIGEEVEDTEEVVE